MKDLIFQKWLQRLQNEKLLHQDGHSRQRSVINSQIVYSDLDFTGSDDHGVKDDVSIMSAHFLKAKKIYKLKKIFNRNCLKPWFDIFVIKLFQGYKRGYKILKEGNQKVQLRNLCLHKILVPKVRKSQRLSFDMLWQSAYRKRQTTHKLRRIMMKLVNYQKRRALNTWKEEVNALVRADNAQQTQMLQEAKE